jgi:hypothetical protein
MRSLTVSLAIAMCSVAFVGFSADAAAYQKVGGAEYSNVSTDGGGSAFTSFKPFYRHYIADVKVDDKLPWFEADFLAGGTFFQVGIDNRSVYGGGFTASALGFELGGAYHHALSDGKAAGGRLTYHTTDEFEDGGKVKLGSIAYGGYFNLNPMMRISIDLETFTFEAGSKSDTKTTDLGFKMVSPLAAGHMVLDAAYSTVDDDSAADTESGLSFTWDYYLSPTLGFGLGYSSIGDDGSTSLRAIFSMDAAMHFALELGKNTDDSTGGEDGEYVLFTGHYRF